MLTFRDLWQLLFRKRESAEVWPPPNARRAKMITISTPLLEELFRTGHRAPHVEVVKGIPPDARIVAGEFDAQRGVFRLLVHSGEFEETPEAMLIPELDVMLARHTILECPWDRAEQDRVTDIKVVKPEHALVTPARDGDIVRPFTA